VTSSASLLLALPVLTMTLNFLDMVLLFDLVDQNPWCWSRFGQWGGRGFFKTA
jgi:hypothetical protein